MTFGRHRNDFCCRLADIKGRDEFRAKFKIPYSYDHLVSTSGQCDASINEKSGNNARLFHVLVLEFEIKMLFLRFLSFHKTFKVGNPLDAGVAVYSGTVLISVVYGYRYSVHLVYFR